MTDKRYPYPVHDPVFEEAGQWYFWNEIWSDAYGPFSSRDIAERIMKKYCEEVLGTITEEEVVHD